MAGKTILFVCSDADIYLLESLRANLAKEGFITEWQQAVPENKARYCAVIFFGYGCPKVDNSTYGDAFFNQVVEIAFSIFCIYIYTNRKKPKIGRVITYQAPVSAEKLVNQIKANELKKAALKAKQH